MRCDAVVGLSLVCRGGSPVAPRFIVQPGHRPVPKRSIELPSLSSTELRGTPRNCKRENVDVIQSFKTSKGNYGFLNALDLKLGVECSSPPSRPIVRERTHPLGRSPNHSPIPKTKPIKRKSSTKFLDLPCIGISLAASHNANPSGSHHRNPNKTSAIQRSTLNPVGKVKVPPCIP